MERIKPMDSFGFQADKFQQLCMFGFEELSNELFNMGKDCISINSQDRQSYLYQALMVF